MQLKEFNIIVDIKRNKEIDNIEVVQKDYESNIFNITILNDLNPYNLEGLNVEIAFAKPDGTTVLQDEENRVVITNASEGELYCILNANTIAAAGKVLAEVRILQDLKVLTTASFNFYVRKAIVNDETVESTNELPILNSLIGQANDLIDVVGQIEKQVPEQVILDLNEVSNSVNQLITDVQSLNTGKADETSLITHTDNTSNPHATTKEHVGLKNVDNIQQASKTEFTNFKTTVDEHLAEYASDDVHGLGFKGVLLAKSATQSIPHNTITKVIYNTVKYDIGGFWDSPNQRIKIPQGVSKVKVKCGLGFVENATGYRRVNIWKNGTSFTATPMMIVPAVTGLSTVLVISSFTLDVVEGDYFEAFGRQTSGGALGITLGDDTWFGLEVVE